MPSDSDHHYPPVSLVLKFNYHIKSFIIFFISLQIISLGVKLFCSLFSQGNVYFYLTFSYRFISQPVMLGKKGPTFVDSVYKIGLAGHQKAMGSLD